MYLKTQNKLHLFYISEVKYILYISKSCHNYHLMANEQSELFGGFFF